jgi:uncharacterized cupin superfamily protein
MVYARRMSIAVIDQHRGSSMRKPQKPAIDSREIEPRTGTGYPGSFRQNVEARRKRILGDAYGLTRYGVNLVELPPGTWSSQRHWHTHEDEFIYIVSGQLALVTDGGEQILTPGMVAGFPAGNPDGHHLINKSEELASYLEIGDRNNRDEAHYPDIDLLYKVNDSGEHEFTNREGAPY